MKWKKSAYAWHRWLGLIVSLQLLAWSVGGFMFSILDIDNVHGDWERNFDPPPAVNFDRVKLSPREATERAAAGGVAAGDIWQMALRERLGRTVYELYGPNNRALATVNADTGEVHRRITEQQAAAAALADFTEPTEVVSVSLFEHEPPLEYRGKPLPAYRVILDHPKHPHIYVSAATGEITTRRNRPWRIFDFFWMLHIMDYRQRDDFNHWLLTGMSLLAILTSASGLLVWTARLRTRQKSNARP